MLQFISYIFAHTHKYLLSRFLDMKFLGGKACAFNVLVDVADITSKEAASFASLPATPEISCFPIASVE